MVVSHPAVPIFLGSACLIVFAACCYLAKIMRKRPSFIVGFILAHGVCGLIVILFLSVVKFCM